MFGFFFCKQKTAYEMRISDWSSDVCSSDLCSAPCVGRISEADYAELAGDEQDFLAGKSTKVQRKLGAAMQSASDAMDFELAAVYRDRLKALTFIQGRSEDSRVGQECGSAWRTRWSP